MSTISINQPRLFEMPSPPPAPLCMGRADVRAIDVKQILTKPNGSLAGFDFSLNPYVGCGFGCSYCFASFFQADAGRFENWGKWIEYKQNAVEALRARRDTLDRRIFMSSATDPYQPLEAKIELTRRILEVLAEPGRQPRLVIQTRGPLVVRDLDILKRFRSVRVNMSITTDSETVRKKFEPSCASIEQRLEAVAKIKEAGIRAYVSVMPMLPIEDTKSFAGRIKATGADGVIAGFFHRRDRAQFASNTRPEAWKLAAAHAWDRKRFEQTRSELFRHIPELVAGFR